MITLLLTGREVCAPAQLVHKRLQQRTMNAVIVDVVWALTFALFIALWALQSGALPPLALVTLAWSLRLGAYLIHRGAASAPEGGRYAHLRARWGARASKKFFVFFQAQAALTALLASALVVPFARAPSTPWLVWGGEAGCA